MVLFLSLSQVTQKYVEKSPENETEFVWALLTHTPFPNLCELHNFSQNVGNHFSLEVIAHLVAVDVLEAVIARSATLIVGQMDSFP